MTLPLTLESVAPTACDAAIASLSELLGDRLSTAVSVREQHGHDASYHRCAPPDAVAFAESTEEVSEIVKVCASHKVPIIPFGSGSGLEGHVVALRGGVTIDLSRMNQIRPVSSTQRPAARIKVVGHGAIAVAALRHRYTPDASGRVACGGHRPLGFLRGFHERNQEVLESSVQQPLEDDCVIGWRAHP